MTMSPKLSAYRLILSMSLDLIRSGLAPLA
jgi:hypothetical protein